MVSPSYVPSRAVLHALRGILFTTSCSVVLLAEERRRRIRLARNALDNARKIHAAKAARGAAAISPRPLESFLPDANDNSRHPKARRIRPGKNERKRLRLMDMSEELDDEHPAPRPRLARDREPSDVKKRLLPDFVGVGSGLADLKSTKIIPAPEVCLERRQLQWNSSVKMPKSRRGDLIGPGEVAVSALVSETCPEPTREMLRPHPQHLKFLWETEPAEPAEPLTKVVPGPEGLVKYKNAVEDASELEQGWLLIHSLPLHPSPAGLPYTEGIEILENILKKLESGNNLGKEYIRDGLEVCCAILGRFISTRLEPDVLDHLRDIIFRVMQCAIARNATSAESVLPSALPLYGGPRSPLVVFGNVLMENGFHDDLIEFIRFLNSPSWDSTGRLVDIVSDFIHARQCGPNGVYDAWNLYKRLRETRIFKTQLLSNANRYRIRRQVILMPLSTDKIEPLDTQPVQQEPAPGRKMSDVLLERAIILNHALQGDWDTAISRLDQLCTNETVTTRATKELLETLTDTLCPKSAAPDLESVIRKLTKYGMEVEYRWTGKIMDWYGSRYDFEGLLSWVQFGRENGLRRNKKFMRAFYTICIKYWRLCGARLDRLRAHIGDESDSLQRVQDAERAMARSQKLPASAEADDDDGASFGPWIDEAHVDVRTLNHGKQQTPSGLYLDLHIPADERRFSERRQGFCKRPALWHEIGQGDSTAYMSVLMSRIRNGEDAIDVVEEALREGATITKFQFHHITRLLLVIDKKATLDVCRIAARVKGEGRLVYDAYNFSTLVYALTGLQWYKSLKRTLLAFSEEWHPWQRSTICKESIKWAMREVAMRAATNKNDKRLMNLMEQLEDAFRHCEESRRDHLAKIWEIDNIIGMKGVPLEEATTFAEETPWLEERPFTFEDEGLLLASAG
ncbi:hypothetical protein S40288_02503 [Stachybotrys chartarum IBT 40288]|nr:hypothetical protein S40288_02503 [Stachybotrys chartarum IBT 40288]